MNASGANSKEIARYYKDLQKSAKKFHFDLGDVRHAVRSATRNQENANREMTKELQNVQYQFTGIGGLIAETNRTIERVGEGINQRLEVLIMLAIAQINELRTISDYLAAPRATAASEKRDMAFISIQNGQYAEALRDFTISTEINDLDHIAWYGLGVTQTIIKQYKHAAESFAKCSRNATRGRNYGDAAFGALLCRAAYYELRPADFANEIWRVLLLAEPKECPDLAVPIAVEVAASWSKDQDKVKIACDVLAHAFAIDPELIAVADSNEVPARWILQACKQAYYKELVQQIADLEGAGTELWELATKLKLVLPGFPPYPQASMPIQSKVAQAVIYKRAVYDANIKVMRDIDSEESDYNFRHSDNDGQLQWPSLLVKPPDKLMKYLGGARQYEAALNQYNREATEYNRIVNRLKLFESATFRNTLATGRSEIQAVSDRMFPEVPRAFQLDSNLISMLGLRA